ncbi:related to multidrug resistance protein [Cephalotrichum gorgonifer]|uniref:Related to multidrug resistance protein n=1 Tax=Cephalotrichum gorgonifer TaxID=2041049 RepID=A0AAE8MNF3_9PEZI|nr:related to multidrug resistance protein [Cephalotrichum gorgonifer]
MEKTTRVIYSGSQETIVVGVDEPLRLDIEMKKVVYGSKEAIVRCRDEDAETEDAASRSQETIVRQGDAPFDPNALDINVEELGRKRPECFSSAFQEFSFCFSVIISMVMCEFFVGGATIIIPPLSTTLNIPPTAQTWVSSVITLAAGATLLPFGRLADMYGGYIVFNAGVVWFAVWSIAAGFSRNYVIFIICRAMQGVGASAQLPTGIMLLGRLYRPGPRKNFIFSMYGTIAPLGFYSGLVLGGVSIEKLTWSWFFWIGGAMSTIALTAALFAIPKDWKAARALGIKMDWWGLVTISPGLVFLIFAITQSSGAPQGWGTPYIIVTMVLGVILLAAGTYVEKNVSKDPFLPAEVFKPKYIKVTLVCLFMAYGAYGVFLYYTNFYIALVLEIPSLTHALWYTPWGISGSLFAATSGFVLHLIPGRILLIVSSASAIGAGLFFALIPDTPNYWANILPAMVVETAFVNILYTTTNVFITTSLPHRHQGLAGALINCSLYLGMCTFQGVTVVAVEANAHKGLKESYKVAFWIVAGIGAVVLVLFSCMDIKSAKSELTADEKRARRALEEEAEEEAQEQDDDLEERLYRMNIAEDAGSLRKANKVVQEV